MGHIELARWADAIVISPCSADSLAKLAAGRGDDLMSAVCLAADSKIFFAPAMNQGMWKDKRTKESFITEKPVFTKSGLTRAIKLVVMWVLAECQNLRKLLKR